MQRLRNALQRIAARRQFPGPAYRDVLQWLHEELRPASYIEIGVASGSTLRLAAPPTIAVGVDPNPKPRADEGWRAPTQLLRIPSDEFFATRTLTEFFETDHFSMAFVDGLHLYEQALRDILNLEPHAGPDSLIAVHDTIPLDEKSSARERATEFYTGDVWKVLPWLAAHRPELSVTTVEAGPSGLTLIAGFGGSGRNPSGAAEIESYKGLSWGDYQRRRHEFLSTIPNDRQAVIDWVRQHLRRDPENPQQAGG